MLRLFRRRKILRLYGGSLFRLAGGHQGILTHAPKNSAEALLVLDLNLALSRMNIHIDIIRRDIDEKREERVMPIRQDQPVNIVHVKADAFTEYRTVVDKNKLHVPP